MTEDKFAEVAPWNVRDTFSDDVDGAYDLAAAVYEMRKFDTGASRNPEEGKYDYEGFLSPFALEAFAKYMHYHRYLEDGTLRDSDNWQKGIPLSSYMKSLWRHLKCVWTWHRGGKGNEPLVSALCGIMFNAMGYLHEIEKPRDDTP